jgi:hypothetical protein
MPRTYLIFGDIESKLDVLRVGCTNAPNAPARESMARWTDAIGQSHRAI